MEKLCPWCGQPSDRGRLRNRTEQTLGRMHIPNPAKPHRNRHSVVTGEQQVRACKAWYTHYPCSRVVLDTLVTNTAREHGCHFLTPVFTGPGLCPRPVKFWTPVFTGRGHGPLTRSVDTGSVYRALLSRHPYAHVIYIFNYTFIIVY